MLDFSRVLAGPFCSMYLADFGAEVIKVETPNGGDETRQWGPPYAGALSAYFMSVNRNKKSLTLNLKHPDGVALARELARRSDVIIENFKTGGMAAFGLDYPTLRAANPRLVYCSITGYGQDSPLADRPGYDYVIQAQSGLMSITGEPDGDPLKVGVAIADVLTGLFAANAIQTALLHREKSGIGQHIDVALLDAQLAALVNVASNFLVSGAVPPRLGNAHPNIAPYQTFLAMDGMFVLAVGNDGQFRACCGVIERPELAEDVRFATNPARVQNRAALVAILEPLFASKRVGEWLAALAAVGVPSGEINTVADALRSPHAAARGLVAGATLADGTPVELLAPILKLTDTPPALHHPPPLLGQDTESILGDVLGKTPHEIAAYRRGGVV